MRFSVSQSGIDVRFDGTLPPGVCGGYLRVGQSLVRTTCRRISADQVRFTPASTLSPGVPYRLVVDAQHEIAFEVDPDETEGTPGVESAAGEGVGNIVVRFLHPVNPLTVDRGGIQVLGPDGQPVAFTMEVSLDGTTIRLTPSQVLSSTTVVVDGVESRRGARVPVARLALQ